MLLFSGLCLERHFLSPPDLVVHKSPGEMTVYSPEAVMQMQLKEQVMLESVDGRKEPFADVVCFGCEEIASVLQLGIDMSVEQFSINTRRQLAEVNRYGADNKATIICSYSTQTTLWVATGQYWRCVLAFSNSYPKWIQVDRN